MRKRGLGDVGKGGLRRGFRPTKGKIKRRKGRARIRYYAQKRDKRTQARPI